MKGLVYILTKQGAQRQSKHSNVDTKLPYMYCFPPFPFIFDP